MLAEIALRRCLHAIGAGAEIDAVEVEFENLVLGEFALEPECQQQFLQLAGEGALLRQEQVLRELLGDGGAALRNAASQDIGECRACDAHRVDAEMRIESAILDRDEGLRQVFRQFLDGGRDAAVAARHHHLAVDARDLDRGRAFGHFQRLDRGQMRADPADKPDQSDDSPEREHGAPIDRAADQRTPVGLCLGFGWLFGRGRRRCGFWPWLRAFSAWRGARRRPAAAGPADRSAGRGSARRRRILARGAAVFPRRPTALPVASEDPGGRRRGSTADAMGADLRAG